MPTFDQRLSAIVEALDLFERSLSLQRPADLGAFIRGRIGLSRAASEFLAHQWQSLSQDIAVRAGGDYRRQEAIRHAFVALRADYSTHIARWDSASLVRNWSEYRSDCQRLIAAMRELLSGCPAAKAA